MNQELTTRQGVLTIRPAQIQDAASLRELRLEALTSHPAAFAADYDLTQAEAADAWSERIRENAAGDKGVIYVAVTDGQLVGMTGLFRERWPKTRHSGTIWGVYVQAAWRGCGVAQGLLQGCIAWAQARGLLVMKLGVVTGNTAAIRCYARCGFRVYGIEPQVIYYDGAYYDEMLMAKLLSHGHDQVLAPFPTWADQ